MDEKQAQAKAEQIWEDMTDRSGMDIDVDDEVKAEIIQTWAEIIAG